MGYPITLAYIDRQASASNSSDTQSWAGSLAITGISGAIDSVVLTATEGTSVYVPYYTGTADASALADPYIYVDPTFPNAANYSIVVSPGRQLPDGRDTGTRLGRFAGKRAGRGSIFRAA
jgi:hypothetical protein